MPFTTLRVPCLVVLSATWTDEFNAVLRGVNDAWVYVEKRVRGLEPDLVLRCPCKLTDDRIDEWRGEVVETIVEACRRFRGTVGVVGRDKEFSMEVYGALRSKGLDAYYDPDNPSLRRAREARITILTVGDRLFRGLSIDRDLVFATYQHHPSSRIRLHPSIIFRLQVEGVSVGRFWRRLTDAMNVQAMFRFIRVHGKRHVVACLDSRAFNALEYFLPQYLYRCTVREVQGVGEVLKYI